MFCNKCGEQLPEGSSFCPRCGAPIAAEQTCPTPAESTETPPSAEENKAVPPKSKTPIIIAIAVIIIAFITILSYRQHQGLNITADTVTLTQLYNPSLGIGLQLGMDKSYVDKHLGAPQSSGDDYLYKDTYLYVSYANGKLAHMYISWPNERWITKNGATIGITADELQQLLGKPNSIQHDDKWWYYFSGNKVAGFEIIRDSVMSIYIYDQTLVTE